ncbi:hypothetical protein BM1_00949 [Bipolaris maydis]|nr:hypothetical protein BM1_00949 [Bipolaris maydis]
MSISPTSSLRTPVPISEKHRINAEPRDHNEPNQLPHSFADLHIEFAHQGQKGVEVAVKAEDEMCEAVVKGFMVDEAVRED